jgi:hypothetical protein
MHMVVRLPCVPRIGRPALCGMQCACVLQLYRPPRRTCCYAGAAAFL